MKLKFKVQQYQSDAVDSVVDCFAGQPFSDGVRYRVDPGLAKHNTAVVDSVLDSGFRNADLVLSDTQLLGNIRAIQRGKNLPHSPALVATAASKVNLDVEMETGTGKTYVYIKTIFELNKRYGWSKFIVVVPSIAIREGVEKSFKITAEHFMQAYGKKVRPFVYNSKQLHQLENFSSNPGINVMIINMQAFNAVGKDNRRIYEVLDEFQSRKPIDVISSNHPILILDEPQKMEGTKASESATLKALAKFRPLAILRYSATHKVTRNKVHRLDALDAFNQKLVKKIAVRGITVKGPAGSSSYLYLEAIEVSKSAPTARMEIEVKQATGIKRVVKRLSVRDNLYDSSNGLAQYKGFIISNIDANRDVVEFTNGEKLAVGDAAGDISEEAIRRIQIRETINAHLEKERALHASGIKVLSLFFIDEVVKYRDYGQADGKGDYARVFEEQYQAAVDEYLAELPLEAEGYREYLAGIDTVQTHEGYFSIDKRTSRLVDPDAKKRGEDAGLSDDVTAYDLILNKKERLLSFAEPVRFIFSHSALREGWDSPNVFGICMLKHSDNSISRRQEVGRGLRLAVNQEGDRMDNPSTVHAINELSVITSESYTNFVAGLQKEVSDSLSARPRMATVEFFKGLIIQTEEGPVEVSVEMSKKFHHFLVKQNYVGFDGALTESYFEAKAANELAKLPGDLEPFGDGLLGLVDLIFTDEALPIVMNDRRPKRLVPNANFDKKEFKELWNRISHKAVYQVDFDSAELIQKSIVALNSQLNVTPLQYVVTAGSQKSELSDDELRAGQGFKQTSISRETHTATIHSKVTYDIVGSISEKSQLTRKTVAAILSGISPEVFAKFRQNPEHFLSEAVRLVNEQKSTTVIEHLAYDTIDDRHDASIFSANQTRQDLSKAGGKLSRHIYDYAVTDSETERAFVTELDISEDVVVYAKLPHGFVIPTPVGDYNPDWAVAFKEETTKHVYFVAETKGSLSTLDFRGVEEAKIECARKFFNELNRKFDTEHVKYEVVTDYSQLMDIVVDREHAVLAK